MEGKDNRSINKRKVMKQMKRKNPHSGAHNTSSSTTPPQRAIADVADSSDERFVRGSRWRPMQQGRCYELDELDVLDDDVLNEMQQAQMRAGDFTAMSKIPTAVDGHFKFASEKNWDAANDADTELLKNTEAGEYFTLNLKLLNSGLKTIPFYKRMDYPSSMFTSQELTAMEKSAEIAEKNYQQILHGNDINPLINILSGSAKSGSNKSNKAEDKAADVNEVAKATEALSVNENTQSPTPAENNNDIQDWLDNVLEEDI